MRVLYLTDSLSDIDGVGRYGISLIKALEALEPGLEVEVLLARKHRPTSDAVPAHWKVSVALPPDYFFYMPTTRFWPSAAASFARTWRAARGCDLVHAIKDYPHSWIAERAARFAGVPCVATAHGTYSVQPLLNERHVERAKRTYARFASMISVSGYTRRRMLELLPNPDRMAERIHVVPNCVDSEHYREPREVGAPPWHEHRYTLGIGELKERKGHHLSVAAWCRVAAGHDDLHHYIVGRPSGDAYQAALERVVAEAGLRERVHFLGNITEDEKVDLIQRAEVFVHTPVTAADGGFEGFGLVYLEASASGVPVIGTLECGAEDAIVTEETGLLVEPSVDAVTVALERLVSDAELRARMGAAGRAHAAKNTWEPNARRVLELYREALR